MPADLKKSPGKTEKDSDVGKIGWCLATGVAMMPEDDLSLAPWHHAVMMEAEPTSESGMLQRHLQRLSVQAIYRSHWATLTCLTVCQCFMLTGMQAPGHKFFLKWHAFRFWDVACRKPMQCARANQHEVYPDGEAQSFCCEPTCQAYTCDIAKNLTLDPVS